MKRILLLSLALLLTAPLLAQKPAMSPYYCPLPPVDSTLTAGQAARDNAWPGFGTGSRRQADMDAARLYKTIDMLGVAATSVGVVGLAANLLVRSSGSPAFSEHPNLGLYVFGGVTAAGVATITVSRIRAVRHAREYDLQLVPAAVPGGAALAVSVQF